MLMQVRVTGTWSVAGWGVNMPITNLDELVTARDSH